MIKQVHEATHLFSLMILSIQATHISKFLFPLYITHQYINIMINQVPGNNNSIYNIDKKKTNILDFSYLPTRGSKTTAYSKSLLSRTVIDISDQSNPKLIRIEN